jgi:hypothetical protein
MIEQIIPNPFGKETAIPYTVYDMQQSAYIMIRDPNGRGTGSLCYQSKGKAR